MKRVYAVKRKMGRDENFASQYTQFMDLLIINGYAREARNEGPVGKTWYLPYHGVYHPANDKLRVVFDAAATCDGSSLNKELMSGPDLTNSLIGVLLRFRLEPYPFTADISSMFYQVFVPEEQQSFLRFFWWPNGDLKQEPREFQMCVHVFGATSSPGCSNFVLRRTADDYQEVHGIETANTSHENFYVDNLLKSSIIKEDASRLALDVQKLCNKGGFDLTKFTSTDSEILKLIPVEKRSTTSIKDVLRQDMHIERALGVYWSLENDTLGFQIILKDVPLTKSVLSSISTIFDPLGIAGPFLLKGRKILQQISTSRSGWDEPPA